MGARLDLPKKQGWRVALSVFLICAWVFASVVATEYVLGYILLWILGKDTFSTPVWTGIYSALSYVVSLVFVILVPWKLFKKWGVTRNDLGLRGWPTWTDIGLAPIGFLATTILAMAVTAFFQKFSWFDAEQTQNIGFSVYLIGWDRIIAFITVVIIAPIAEEIMFRGWLYGKLREKTASKMADMASIVVSSLLVSILFGIIHFQWNVGVTVFSMSLVLCAMREITGTVYSGILMHMLKNGIAFYLLYVLGIT